MKKQIFPAMLATVLLLVFAPFYSPQSIVTAPISANASMQTITLVPTNTMADTITDDKGLGYPDSRKVARDAKGNLYIAYRKKYRAESTLAYHIFVAKSADNGATWAVLNQNQPIETTGDYTQRVPSLSIDAKDVIHVTWYGLDAAHTAANDRQIKYTQSADGGKTWQTWRNIAEVGDYRDETLWQEHPVIYTDAQDKLYIIWEGRDGVHKNGQVKLTQSSDSGQTWTPWTNVAPVDAMYFSRPTLMATSDSTVLYILAYAQRKTGAEIVWTQSVDGGATWQAWTAVAPDQPDQRHVSLAIDSTDRLHAVWRQQPAGSPATAPTQIHYAFYENGAWSTPQRVSDAPGLYQFFPSITVGNHDQVWVVWQETADAAGYPKEDPAGGTVYYTVKTNAGWQRQAQLGARGHALYPSLSWRRQTQQATPDVVWLEQDNTAPTDTFMICAASGDRPAQLALKTK